MAASGWARSAAVLLCASSLLVLLPPPRAYASEGPARTPGEAAAPARKKKDIRDYNDADMARLLEQWEVRGAPGLFHPPPRRPPVPQPAAPGPAPSAARPRRCACRTPGGRSRLGGRPSHPEAAGGAVAGPGVVPPSRPAGFRLPVPAERPERAVVSWEALFWWRGGSKADGRLVGPAFFTSRSGGCLLGAGFLVA